MTPQHHRIIELHKDGLMHCSTEIEYIRDQRKRISELRGMGYVFESQPCRGYCGKYHNSRLLMRRLVKIPSNYELRAQFNGMIVSAYRAEVLEQKEFEKANPPLFH